MAQDQRPNFVPDHNSSGPSEPGSDQPPQNQPSPKPGDETTPATPQSADGICPRCSGTGKLNGEPCPDCEGTGTIEVIVGDA